MYMTDPIIYICGIVTVYHGRIVSYFHTICDKKNK